MEQLTGQHQPLAQSLSMDVRQRYEKSQHHPRILMFVKPCFSWRGSKLTAGPEDFSFDAEDWKPGSRSQGLGRQVEVLLCQGPDHIFAIKF